MWSGQHWGSLQLLCPNLCKTMWDVAVSSPLGRSAEMSRLACTHTPTTNANEERLRDKAESLVEGSKALGKAATADVVWGSHRIQQAQDVGTASLSSKLWAESLCFPCKTSSCPLWVPSGSIPAWCLEAQCCEQHTSSTYERLALVTGINGKQGFTFNWFLRYQYWWSRVISLTFGI